VASPKDVFGWVKTKRYPKNLAKQNAAGWRTLSRSSSLKSKRPARTWYPLACNFTPSREIEKDTNNLDRCPHKYIQLIKFRAMAKQNAKLRSQQKHGASVAATSAPLASPASSDPTRQEVLDYLAKQVEIFKKLRHAPVESRIDTAKDAVK
jgi:hypothetical protein